MSPSWVMVLKLCKKLCPFCIFFADVSKKSKVVIAIYVYASKSYRLPLLENGIGYYAMTFSLEDISVWSSWILKNSAECALFLYFIPRYLVNCCSEPYKSNIFSKRAWWGLSDGYK